MNHDRTSRDLSAVSDERLSELVRMAGEAERFELDALSDEHAAGGGNRFGGRVLAWFSGLAAAACLGLGVYLATLSGGSAVVPQPIAGGPVVINPVPVDTASEVRSTSDRALAAAETGAKSRAGTSTGGNASMVLALFEGETDDCACVQWKVVRWGEGRGLADVPRGELINAALASACAPNPSRVVVLAMENDSNGLPSSPEGAEAIMRLVADGPQNCGMDAECLDDAARESLPATMTFMSATMALR